MRATDRSLARLLRVYPRAYRERKGDEILATLMSAQTTQRELPAREVLGIVRHGLGLRFRQLRPLTLAIVLLVVGAGIGAGVSALSGPTAYAANARITPTVAPRSMHEMVDSTTRAQTLARMFDQLIAQPHTRQLAFGPLGHPWPSCTTGARSSSVEITCVANRSERAQAGLAGLTAIMGRELLARRVAAYSSQLKGLETMQVADRRHVTELSVEVAHVSRTSPRFSTLTREQAAGVARVQFVEQEETRDVFSVDAPAFSFVGGGPPQPVYGTPAGPIAIGALAGLAFGLVLVVARRRGGPRQPIVAS